MKVELSTLLIILGCAVVTILPRVIPFVVVRNMNLPEPVLKWLSYIPVCLLTALVVQGMIVNPGNHTLPSIHWLNVAATIPTLLTALKTRSLIGTVMVGIATVALLQWIITLL